MYAKYTEFLGDLMKNPQTSEAVTKALSTYPLYTPQAPEAVDLIPDRSELNQRLLNHYKYREIGFETVGRFLDELEITMCEIMPRYNELYKTIEIMADLENPFDNVDIIETFDETKNGTADNTDNITKTGSGLSDTTGSSESTTTASSESNTISETNTKDTSTTQSTVSSNSKNVHADTPQDSLGITAAQIDSVSYADSVSWNKSDGSDSATTSGTSESTSGSDSESSSTQSDDTSTTQHTEESSTENSNITGTHTNNEQTQHTYTRKGNQGVNTYAHDMIEFRTSIIDVTNQIINDDRISELFVRVF